MPWSGTSAATSRLPRSSGPGSPPMEAEWRCGERWGSVRKLDVTLGEDGSAGAVRLASKAGVPEEREDSDLGEEDEEDVAPRQAIALPALPAEARDPWAAVPGTAQAPGGHQPEPALRLAEASGPPRTVIVT